MVRTSLLSLALLALAGATATHAKESKAKEEERDGYRVYSVSIRCQVRTLVSKHDYVGDAFGAAAALREKSPRQAYEVTIGSEGKKVPAGEAALYFVYTKNCEKQGWVKRATFSDRKKADADASSRKDKGTQVAVLLDFAPKEVFHVYGGGCSRSWGQRGTYASIEEAKQAADELRTQKKWNCTVTSGTRGPAYPGDSPAKYLVYTQSCKRGWYLAGTEKDAKKAQALADSYKKRELRFEVVHHHEFK